MLIKLFNQIRSAKWSILSILLLSTALTGCNGGSATNSSDGQVIGSNGADGALIIEKSAVVPVLNGKTTFAGVYVYNNSDKPLTGIQYTIKSTAGVPALNLVNSDSCRNLEPYSSCLVNFYTPKLDAYQSGSSTLLASYANHTAQNVVEYAYFDVEKYDGVNFSGNIKLFGADDYATVYAFAGKAKSYSQVGFASTDQSVGINHGLINGKVDISADQVIPLELKSSHTVTKNHVYISGIVANNAATSKMLKNGFGAGLLSVNISPQPIANLIMSTPPVMNTLNQSSITLTLYNNGIAPATDLGITTQNTNIIQIAPASSNSCLAISQLAAGASCQFKINLLTGAYNSNGSINVDVDYNNSQEAKAYSQIVYYVNNKTAPQIKFSLTNGGSYSLIESVYQINSLSFTAINVGQHTLTNMQKSISDNLPTYNPQIASSGCATSLNGSESCIAVVQLAATSVAESGIFYLKITGNSAQESSSYSFVSFPVTAAVLPDLSQVVISSTTPANNATANRSTSIVVNFNQSMKAVSLSTGTIKLFKVSDGSQVALISQGVTNSNQTITLKTASGELEANTQYRIVLVPNQIYNINNSAMNSTISEQTITTFTTNNITSPVITSYLPANAATEISKSVNPTISFSKAMNAATINATNIQLQKVSDSSVISATVSYSDANGVYQAIINPATALDDSTAYQIVIKEDQVQDTDGNNISNASNVILSSFTTGAVTTPAIISVTPLNGSTNVATNSRVSLTFSQPMESATLTNTNITLTSLTTNTSVTLDDAQIGANNLSVSFKPTQLESGASYALKIDAAAVTDANANPLGSGINSISTFVASKNISGVMISGNYGNVYKYGFYSQAVQSVRFPVDNNKYYGAALASDGAYVIAGAYAGGSGNPIIMRSTDNGNDWYAAYGLSQEAMRINFPGKIICMTSGVCLVGNGSLGQSTSSGTRLSSGVLRSEDNGKTWYLPNINLSGLPSNYIGNKKYDMLGGDCNSSVCILTGGLTSSNTMGLIERSTDNGVTWTATQFNASGTTVTSALTDTYCSRINGNCLLVSYSGNVYLSSDFGITWALQASFDSTNLNGIVCNDADTYCVTVANGGKIYTSQGTGQEWTILTGVPNVNYTSVSYANNAFVVVGATGTIVKITTDGNYATKTSGVTNTLNRVSCKVDNCIAVASTSGSGNYAPILISSDNGETWANKAAQPDGGSYSSIEGYNASYCYPGGATCLTGNLTGVINRTTDSGATWSTITTTNLVKKINGVNCYGANCIMVTEADSSSGKFEIARSVDYGASWTGFSDSVPNLTFNDVKCVSATKCIIVASSSNKAYSVDPSSASPALTEIDLPDTTSHTLRSLSCTGGDNGQVCIAVGGGSTVLKSTNQGSTWSISSTGIASTTLNGVSCSLYTCIAVGTSSSKPVIYRSAGTSNATMANSWTKVAELTGANDTNMNSVACADGYCIANANSSKVLLSTDDGLNWSDLSVYFSDPHMFTITTY